MKLLSRVVWSEGMYLGPQHFQAQARCFEDTLQFVSDCLWYEPWGLVSLQLDAESILNGTVSLLHASGRFPDGLAFDCPASDAAPPARVIRDVFPSTHDSLDLCLAVPRRVDGALYDLDNTGDGLRFGVERRELPDETTGHDERPVELGRKNLRILTQAECGPGLHALPLARVRRSGAGRFAYDAEFIPPCLRISASEPLLLLLGRLIETLEEKSASLGRGHGRTGGFAAGFSPGEVANFWFLHALRAALGGLRHLHRTKRGHPEELFREWSRLAGALCTFSLESSPASLPHYDHRDPGPCFRQLEAHIRRHLEVVAPDNALTVPLRGVRPSFYEGAIRDPRCFGRSRWILGVRSPMGEAALITAVPRLAKVCSSRFVPELVNRALPGLTLTHLPVPPSSVRPQADMQYFSLSTAGPCWEHIRQIREIGVYIPDEIPGPNVELTVLLES